MSMLTTISSWFKPKNKHNVVIPSKESKELLHGLELIKAFTTPTEPKVVDFPKGQYKIYWETFLDTVEGGYMARVRFYGFNGVDFSEEHTFIKPSIPELKQEVDNKILTTMEQNKR